MRPIGCNWKRLGLPCLERRCTDGRRLARLIVLAALLFGTPFWVWGCPGGQRSPATPCRVELCLFPEGGAAHVSERSPGLADSDGAMRLRVLHPVSSCPEGMSVGERRRAKCLPGDQLGIGYGSLS